LASSVYSDELAERICQRIADGETLSRICADEGMPDSSTVRRWEREDRGGFRAIYARAREEQAETFFDDVLDVADGAAEAADALAQDAADRVDEKYAADVYRRVYSEEIQARRLRIDSRKWMLARMNRAKYGDRVDSGGSVEVVYRIKTRAEE